MASERKKQPEQPDVKELPGTAAERKNDLIYWN